MLAPSSTLHTRVFPCTVQSLCKNLMSTISSEGLPEGVSAEASKIEVSDLRSVRRIVTEFSCGNFKLTVSRAHQSYNRF